MLIDGRTEGDQPDQCLFKTHLTYAPETEKGGKTEAGKMPGSPPTGHHLHLP